MPHVRRPVFMAVLFGLPLWVPATHSGRAADPEKSEVYKKREELWKSLRKALPKEYEEIDAYAENPSLTTVLFRSRMRTFLFSLKAGKVRPVEHQRALAAVNRIAYHVNEKGVAAWILWYNGEVQLIVFHTDE